MPKPKNAVDRLVVIRGHKLRRDILQAAQEAHAAGRLVSPVGLHRQLKAPLPKTSYHVKVLAEVGALRLMDQIQRRGAFENLYGINEDFLAEVTDAVALDQIAEALEDDLCHPPYEETMHALHEIVRSTGRPVEA